MTDLRPCGECRRHVSIEEPACPFCGAAREVEEPASRTLGRLSRAAVFAGATVAIAAGCGGKKPKTDAVENHGEQMTSDGGVAQPPPPPDNSNIPMPYGAPPARRRVV